MNGSPACSYTVSCLASIGMLVYHHRHKSRYDMKICPIEKTGMYEMNVQSGIDLVKNDRILKAVEKQGRPFLDRIWTGDEQADCHIGTGRPTMGCAASLAARFAAKEAVAKALGTGSGPEGVRGTDSEIRRLPGGQPRVCLTGGAAARYQSMGGMSISVSMSHEAGLSIAHCVILYREPL